MIKNKTFIKFIMVALLCTFLTFNVGKVTHVSAAFSSVAAVAGTAFILTGAVYLSYIALTHGEMVLPAAGELHNYLGDIGRKVSQYSSGAAAYQDIYQGLSRDPLAGFIDGVWTWTQDRLKSFANDFSDTRINNDILSYDVDVDTYYTISTSYDYSSMNILPAPSNVMYNGNLMSLDEFISQGLDVVFSYGAKIIRSLSGNNYYIVGTNITEPVRNYLYQGFYYPQKFVNNQWVDASGLFYSAYVYYSGNRVGNITNAFSPDYYLYTSGVGYDFYFGASAFPVFSQADIYDSETGEIIPAEVISPVKTVSPQWIDPDNDNRPIIPWVPIPQLPANVTPPTGYIQPQWGFNLQDLLDLLEDLAGRLIDIGGIAALINEFAGLHGDNYYLEYNDGDINYYTYYQPVVYDNDNEYITYNIDVSEVDKELPVDLNTIQLYTNNRYIEAAKSAALNGGSLLRDFVVFWYDVDSMIVYVIFGSAIVTLIAAFIGKWGHS